MLSLQCPLLQVAVTENVKNPIKDTNSEEMKQKEMKKCNSFVLRDKISMPFKCIAYSYLILKNIMTALFF